MWINKSRFSLHQVTDAGTHSSTPACATFYRMTECNQLWNMGYMRNRFRIFKDYSLSIHSRMAVTSEVYAQSPLDNSTLKSASPILRPHPPMPRGSKIYEQDQARGLNQGSMYTCTCLRICMCIYTRVYACIYIYANIRLALGYLERQGV